ncbi:MarR family winged helix-turn-helix transcriptional regulator [Pseudorhodoplanes sinuspersici]|uniref:Uncharacterized protein n=1 Tax=Pseudorhodoplanes sinuspersici TaxID=1235591 RepID=A0A1W6ZQP7_9HYPH|nr:MarR family transcriptional regulator [Pseudorhodoplanes sinuspersici]ARP99084.1 hypothetical protein CAK95_08300 [Pseudorhodoplanes sinuspersici]RKE69268.1 DNA-binding MarR family transcriptional regulator [Pseudorhodoplanes sinuspersici]
MHKNQAADALDVFAEEWSQARPDLDFAYLATVGRILRVSAHLREAMDQWLEPFGITWEMFDLLASLQRSGADGGLRPTDLYEACMLSSGATTNRIDRAEKLNYAVRKPDPADGRAVRIALTKRGANLAHKAMTKHAACAGEISNRLTAAEQKQLARLLRKMLLSLETDRDAVKPQKQKPPSKRDAARSIAELGQP